MSAPHDTVHVRPEFGVTGVFGATAQRVRQHELTFGIAHPGRNIRLCGRHGKLETLFIRGILGSAWGNCGHRQDDIACIFDRLCNLILLFVLQAEIGELVDQ